MGESLKADGKIPWALNLAQAAAGAFDFDILIFWATIAQAAWAARAGRDSMVGLISISCLKL